MKNSVRYRIGAAFAIVLTICMLASPAFSIAGTKTDTAYTSTKSYIRSRISEPIVGSIGGEWAVIGLTRSGAYLDAAYKENYYSRVVEYVKANINADEQLHRAKSTDNSRIILALTCMGRDPANVGGHNLLQGLSDMEYLKKQGCNGPIWALIALNSGAYTIPLCKQGQEQTTRKKLVNYILEVQLPNGGWALSGSNADPDMTGMALQALAPYYHHNKKVTTAVDKALGVLSSLQQSDGGFSSWGTKCSESCAQVIVALCSLGINPDTDTRFVKSAASGTGTPVKKSVIDGLLDFYITGGGFLHCYSGTVMDKEPNQMATEQAFYALVAFDRLERGQTAIYTVSSSDNVEIKPAGSIIKIDGQQYKVTKAAKKKLCYKRTMYCYTKGTVKSVGTTGSEEKTITVGGITYKNLSYKR